MENSNIVYNERKAITIIEEDVALTFIKPFPGGYENHLFVIFEDAYGDAVSGLMHMDTISATYKINKKIISEVLKKLTNEN